MIPSPGDVVRRQTWPAGMYVIVRTIEPEGIRGQWHVLNRPSGSPSCYFSYHPCGVSMPFQLIAVET